MATLTNLNDQPARQTYTIEETARILGIGRNTAYTAAASGAIEAIKIGKRLLVPKATIERMLGKSGR